MTILLTLLTYLRLNNSVIISTTIMMKLIFFVIPLSTMLISTSTTSLVQGFRYNRRAFATPKSANGIDKQQVEMNKFPIPFSNMYALRF